MNHLRACRQAAELTQQGLAVRAGLSISAIVKLEAGKVTPTLSTAQAIASALVVPVEQIWPPDSKTISAPESSAGRPRETPA